MSDEKKNAIAENVERLKQYFDVSKVEIFKGAGISKSRFYSKMSGARGWKVAEIEAIAVYFKVPVSVLMERGGAERWISARKRRGQTKRGKL